MTKLLEQAFQKASKLPQEEQDAMAAFMIGELEHKNWLSAAGVSLERAYGPEEPDYSRAGVALSQYTVGLVAEGDLVVAALPQASGTPKLRPVLLLRKMPGFGDFLACGISSQIHQAIPDFDLVLTKDHPDFASSGLFTASVVRLGFLGILVPAQMKRKLGRLSPGTMKAVRQKLAELLTTNS